MQLKLLRTILFALLFVTGANFQIYAQKSEGCVDYMRHILYTPVSLLGFEKAPAAIISTSDCCNTEVDGKFRLGIGLRNFSDKTITAVKFQWYLFSMAPRQDMTSESRAANTAVQTRGDKLTFEERKAILKEIILAQDEISIIDVDKFQPKLDVDVQTVVSCEKVFEAIGNVSEGKELVIEFVVSEISFSDGSNWKRK